MLMVFKETQRGKQKMEHGSKDWTARKSRGQTLEK
jgi:hypothetical protein